MKATFTNGEQSTVLDRGALYATTQTANDARLGVMGGNFLYPIGKYSDFANYAQKAMELAPTNSDIPFYIASIYVNVNEITKAKEYRADYLERYGEYYE